MNISMHSSQDYLTVVWDCWDAWPFVPLVARRHHWDKKYFASWWSQYPHSMAYSQGWVLVCPQLSLRTHPLAIFQKLNILTLQKSLATIQTEALPTPLKTRLLNGIQHQAGRGLKVPYSQSFKLSKIGFEGLMPHVFLLAPISCHPLSLTIKFPGQPLFDLSYP